MTVSTDFKNSSATPRGYRFGPFQVDPRSGELRRNGIRLRLQEQPFQILVAMLERPNEPVTREELKRRLWPADTFVDFENSLNSAVNRLRDVLGDTADNPQYVETLPRRGYRFIAPVTVETDRVQGESADTASAEAPEEPRRVEKRPSKILVASAAAILAVALAGAILWQKLRVPAAASGRIVVAILPFDDLTGAHDNQYFGEGLTEELILQLGRLRPERLAVIARTSVLQYKGTQKPIRQIGRELGVQYVLTGTIRAPQLQNAGAPGRLLISAQLVEVQNQSSLWSESYEHALRDFLQVQNDVAMRVTKSLAAELMVDLQNVQAASSRIRPEAMTAYLKGRFFWNQRSQTGGENTQRAAEFFEEAIRLEPNYAAAHAALAAAKLSLVTAGRGKAEEIVPVARALNARALSIDAKLALAYLNLARISFTYDWDWYGAEKLFQKAILLDAASADNHFYYAILLAALRRFEEADRQIEIAQRLDPTGPSPHIFGAYVAERLGDAERAVRMSRKYGELLGDPLGHLHAAGTILARQGKCNEARDLLRQADAAPATNAALYSGDRATILAKCGDLPGALRARDTYFQLSPVTDYHRAVVDAALGRSVKACEWLQSAERARDASLAMLHLEPNFDPIRREPCFARVVRRLGLE